MQLQNIHVRTAQRDDLKTLHDMCLDMKTTKDLDYFSLQFDFQDEGSRILLIASRDRKDCGYCILNWQPKYAFFRRLGIPEIQDLNVVPSERRQGIGRFLIHTCEAMARARNHDVMGIGVGLPASYGAAQKLYIREGYIPDGNGVTYDRQAVASGEFRPIDDNLSLMMVKKLG